MNSRGTPITKVYHDSNILIVTDRKHSAALWDHLYSNWTGNNITDVIIENEILRYNVFYYKYIAKPKEERSIN
jgi:hypothetical protein